MIAMEKEVITMEMEDSDRQNVLDQKTLIELYKVADENHRFYVDKRFTIMSLYFPLTTIILSAIYAALSQQAHFRVLIAVLGIFLTFFLYGLETRNWVLSGICLHTCKRLGAKIDGAENLHVKLVGSYHEKLPSHATFLDNLAVRLRTAVSQHWAVSRMTIFLLIYWLTLAIISLL